MPTWLHIASQNRSKNDENVDPKRLQIMHPFSLRFWPPKTSLLGFNLEASSLSVSLQDGPRGLPEPNFRACFFYLRAFLFLLTRLPFLLTRLLFHLRTYDRFLTDFWLIFGRLFIDFWSICWSILVGPQSKYLNFPGYFFDVLLAMVKYRGRFKYIIFMGATGQVLKLSWILFQRFFRDGYVSGKVQVHVLEGFTEHLLKLLA